MTDFRRARWGLRRTFQTEQAIEELSLYDNVAMVEEHSSNNGGTSRRDDVLGSLDFVGLGDLDPHTKVGTLGARERRLVEIARAVVGKPRAVLLDEPAAGLPDEETEHMGSVIRRIPEEIGALVILVDHDMNLVSACCELTSVLDFGKLIASGPDRRGAARRAGRSAPISERRRYEPDRQGEGAGRRGQARGGKKGDVLTLESLTVARGGRPVVRDVSLRIRPGEVTALLGPNGAGKSSLVLAVSGVLRPESGSVRLNGDRPEREAAGEDPRRRSRRGPGGPAAALRAHRRGQPAGRDLLAAPSEAESRPRLRARDVPRAQGSARHPLPVALRRRAADARAGAGAGLKPKFVLIDELSLGLAPVVVKRLIPTIEKLAAGASACC